MPIPGVPQPEVLPLDASLRLLRSDGEAPDAALRWYQDPETLLLVDGAARPYDRERLAAMYRYLAARGELYFIQYRPDAGSPWRFIGDITFWQEDLPIVIGEKSLRGQGIGRRVVRSLVARGRALGYPWLEVAEIYNWNPASRRMFVSVGFRAVEQTEKGSRYRLELAVSGENSTSATVG